MISDFKDMVIWQLLVKEIENFLGFPPFSPFKCGQPKNDYPMTAYDPQSLFSNPFILLKSEC